MSDSMIIDRLGGNRHVAQLCEITPQAVSQWRKDGIPKAQRNYLRAIRPDAFGQASNESPATSRAA